MNSNGTLVSPLVDFNTSVSYGKAYMDPTKFYKAVERIEKSLFMEQNSNGKIKRYNKRLIRNMETMRNIKLGK